jgi:hypothetical protein
MILSDGDQAPIDEIVRVRTIARLIVKNSLNEVLRQQLVQTFSVNNNNTCYPNSIVKAVSLLCTFKKQVSNGNGSANAKSEEAVVSYHEIADDTGIPFDNEDDCSNGDTSDINSPVNDSIGDNTDIKTANDYEATVMAAIITEAEQDQFIGASFVQLRDVDDAYENDEPDIVCYAHNIDASGAYEYDEDEPQFITEANNNAEVHIMKGLDHVVRPLLENLIP